MPRMSKTHWKRYLELADWQARMRPSGFDINAYFADIDQPMRADRPTDMALLVQRNARSLMDPDSVTREVVMEVHRCRR